MTLEIENLVGGYSRVPVLKDISFTVKAGELVGLIYDHQAHYWIVTPTKGKDNFRRCDLKIRS